MQIQQILHRIEAISNGGGWSVWESLMEVYNQGMAEKLGFKNSWIFKELKSQAATNEAWHLLLFTREGCKTSPAKLISFLQGGHVHQRIAEEADIDWLVSLDLKYKREAQASK